MNFDGPLPCLQIVRFGKGPILVGDEDVRSCVMCAETTEVLQHNTSKHGCVCVGVCAGVCMFV